MSNNNTNFLEPPSSTNSSEPYKFPINCSFETLFPNQPWNMEVGLPGRDTSTRFNHDIPGFFAYPVAGFYPLDRAIPPKDNALESLPSASLPVELHAASMLPGAQSSINVQKTFNDPQNLYRSDFFLPALKGSVNDSPALHERPGAFALYDHRERQRVVSFPGHDTRFARLNTSPHPFARSSQPIATKARIRWTQELHNQFVDCVIRLGGPEKATPKGILNLMDIKGLTIYHVKSHLQKHRIARFIPETSEVSSGKQEKKIGNEVTMLEAIEGTNIAEALQVQHDVQRKLHEQLEIQKNLQSRIEEQGRQLKKMLDYQLRTRSNESFLFNSFSSYSDEPLVSDPTSTLT